jgi:hypothetical protein
MNVIITGIHDKNDIDDYFLHLQFIKMKKQSIDFVLTN